VFRASGREKGGKYKGVGGFGQCTKVTDRYKLTLKLIAIKYHLLIFCVCEDKGTN